MFFIQNRVFPIAVILCALLASCSPDPDPITPTEAIRIRNIQSVKTNDFEPFKVFVQLSLYDNSGSAHTAEGALKLSAEGQNEITISLKKPGTNEAYKGTDWKNVCVVISKESVANYNDIAIRAARSGPSSATVDIDLKAAGVMTGTYDSGKPEDDKSGFPINNADYNDLVDMVKADGEITSLP